MSSVRFSKVMIMVKMSRDFVLVFCIATGGLASFILFGCGLDRKSVVEAAPVTDEAKAISCLGRIVAGEGALKIAAPPESIVGELLVHRGSKVARGDVLAVLQE